MKNAAYITNCSFSAVKWDETAVRAIITVAEAMKAEAAAAEARGNALSQIATVFKATNITVDSFVKVENDKINVKGVNK